MHLIYKTVVPMKIYPLCHEVAFHPSLSFFSFCIVKQCEKIMKEGVDQGVVRSTYYITQTAAT